MSDPLAKVTHLPPKKLALVVGGGVVAGLLWRRFGKKSSGGGTADASSDAVDLSQFALAGSSTGPYAGSTPPADDGGTRDTGGSTISLPAVGYVVTINGQQYYTLDNGVTYVPVNGAANPPIGQPVPVPVPHDDGDMPSNHPGPLNESDLDSSGRWKIPYQPNPNGQ